MVPGARGSGGVIHWIHWIGGRRIDRDTNHNISMFQT